MSLFSFVKSQRLTVKSSTRGFTLVEMLVAFGIFSIIMVISIGSLISLIEANHKARSIKTVVNNLHFALENMSRTIRTGSNYHCGFGTVTDPADCPTEPSIQLVFKDKNDEYVAYRWTGSGDIERSKSSSADTLLSPDNFVPITAPEVEIDRLSFYVDGADNDNEAGNTKEQPRVLIVLRGRVLGKSKVPSKFEIQTMVSQRLLDVAP